MLVISTIFSVQTNKQMINERNQNMLKFLINNCFNNGLEGSIELADWIDEYILDNLSSQKKHVDIWFYLVAFIHLLFFSLILLRWRNKRIIQTLFICQKRIYWQNYWNNWKNYLFFKFKWKRKTTKKTKFKLFSAIQCQYNEETKFN